MRESLEGDVLSNTTPLIALSLIDALDVLRQLYGQIVVPPAVRQEVEAGGDSGVGIESVRSAQWIVTRALVDPRHAELLTDLGPGEAEVLGLAIEIDPRLVLIDERLARRHAARLGLKVTGTLGVLRAKNEGLLPSLRRVLADLRNGGFWIGDDLVARVLDLAGE